MQLSDLPVEILDNIFLFLDGASFGKLLLLCRRLLKICGDERYWQQRCKNDFLLQTLSTDPTWRQQYGRYHKQFACCGVDVYKRIRSAWMKIERFFQNRGNRISFDGPMSWEDAQHLQTQLGPNVILPKDYICSLMIHNGQSIDESVLNGVSSGAFGSLYAYEDYKTEFLASTMNVLIAQGHINADRRRSELSFVCLTIAVTNRYWSHSHLLCVSPDLGDIGNRTIKLGEVIIGPQLRSRYDLPSWIVAKSYTDWLEQYADSLDEGRFCLSLNEPVTDNNELLRFYWAPGCEVRTGPFLCRVATAFIPENSAVNINPPRFFFSYRITFMMDADADPVLSCQLESRHWVITDANGKVDRVDGPGVIGQFPILRPGTSFSYVSCTAFPTTTGQMEGRFKMKYLSPSCSHGFVDIVCPVFTMQAPPWDILKFIASPSDSLERDDSFDQDSMP